MKALILAAGTGSRLSSITHGLPKGLFRHNGETIVGRQMRFMRERGVSEFHIVTGYSFELYHQEFKTPDVHFHFNPFFNSSNNIISTWIANPLMQADYLITYSDLLYEPRVLDQLLQKREHNVVAIDRTKIEANNCLVTYHGDQITKMSKEIPVELAQARFIGLALIKKSFQPQLQTLLEQALQDKYLNDYYTKAFDYLRPTDARVQIADCSGLLWQELDGPEDFSKYKALGLE